MRAIVVASLSEAWDFEDFACCLLCVDFGAFAVPFSQLQPQKASLCLGGGCAMHGADYAAEAAERVKVIQAEAEELLSEINRETEIKRQQIEDEQLELQSGHAAKIQELQLEIRAVRDDADERIHKIEQEMLVHQSSIEDEVLQKSAERSEALKAIREEAHEMSSLADEEYQKSLDQEVEAHERARKEMMDLEDERSRKVEEIEQSCQLWITAFNQRQAHAWHACPNMF